jgi:hypothetical protein
MSSLKTFASAQMMCNLSSRSLQQVITVADFSQVVEDHIETIGYAEEFLQHPFTIRGDNVCNTEVTTDLIQEAKELTALRKIIEIITNGLQGIDIATYFYNHIEGSSYVNTLIKFQEPGWLWMPACDARDSPEAMSRETDLWKEVANLRYHISSPEAGTLHIHSIHRYNFRPVGINTIVCKPENLSSFQTIINDVLQIPNEIIAVFHEPYITILHDETLQELITYRITNKTCSSFLPYSLTVFKTEDEEIIKFLKCCNYLYSHMI